MSLKNFLRVFTNNEQLVQKVSESYPIRRAAQLTTYVVQKGQEKAVELKESEAVTKLWDNASKETQKLGERASSFKTTFMEEVKNGWAKEKSKMGDSNSKKKDL